MTKIELEKSLAEELEKHSLAAATSIKNIINAAPEKATTLNFEIFPSQDGDGFFSIRANLDGPDLYVLNKAIDSVADIFDPIFTDNGIEPYIPTVDPFDVEYEVNDVIVDCSAKWLKKVWGEVDLNLSIPVSVVAHDGYGSVTPLQLNNN